ncbi:Clp protease N-terminal domain-containing protein [Catellatospora citrea]|uniref:Clp R domain-containing protein n=1 Tax=Catellatospora citrea TaxID=53366 RepID=A0A8J3KGF2_9ACTN|nr:Clp protease N-terminal domain-containing protein [Catellatospora citrea]RKE11210.1 ClpA/ClpB-like protein [Catellatospora citrea]GIF96675.1 hypothetical protein Cci01nite_17690 [Catellatospora citrea]
MPRIADTDPHGRYTDRARQVAQAAWREACTRGHENIGPEHYLLALLREGDEPGLIGTGALILEDSFDIPLDALRERLDAAVGRTGWPHQHGIPTTAATQRALRLASDEAARLGDERIGTEHLLLGIAAEGTSTAAQALAELGATADRIRDEIVLLGKFSRGCRMPTRSLDTATESPVEVPADIRDYDTRISELRQQKEAAVDAADYEAAGAIRTAEKQLLAQRTARARRWSANVDVVAVVTELQDLREQNQRLMGLLREHGIEPR